MLSFSPTNDSFPLPDDLPVSHYTHGPNSPADTSQMFQHDASLSKHQTNHMPQEQADYYPRDVQGDQQQRAAALGPPACPHGVKCVSQEQTTDRLERRLEELARMLDMLKAQVITAAKRCHFFKNIKPEPNSLLLVCSRM